MAASVRKEPEEGEEGLEDEWLFLSSARRLLLFVQEWRQRQWRCLRLRWTKSTETRSGFTASTGNMCSNSSPCCSVISWTVSEVARTGDDSRILSSVRDRTFVNVTVHLKLFMFFICFLSGMLPANGSKELKSPYFVVAFDVCNRADTLIYNLQAEGDGLTFDIMKSDDNIYRKGNSIVLLRAITDPWKEMTVDILVTGSSNGTDIKSQGGLSIRVKVDDSYCKKNGDFNCTPAVVTLSSLLLIASTGLAVCLIILLRRRNLTILSLEENKSDAHSDRQSLSNGISIENVIETNNSDHDSMSRASTESMQYPRKSSLKTVRSLAELFVDADQDGSEEGSYNNGGYEDTPGYPDVLKVEGGPGLGAEEPRRKSVVTFAETAQVRIMDTK